MASNQLPEDMGKKIVEALRKQAQSGMNNDSVNNIEEITADAEAVSDTEPHSSLVEDSVTVEKETVISPSVHTPQAVQLEQPKPSVQTVQTAQSIQQPQYSQQVFQTHSQIQDIAETPLQFTMSGIQTASQYSSLSQELPTNVAVLKKLINQLPAGVSKQVGAQIIRQTIEALGISMNSVLQEAQQVQDSLNSAVTDCTLKMQEYKNQIMQLEANTRDYQRQMAQINDLISLFILTDNK